MASPPRPISDGQSDYELVPIGGRHSGSGQGIDEEGDGFEDNPFEPLRGVQFDGSNIITFRAFIVGSLCGALVNASNIYLGFKAGWTSSANLFGAIVGFSVLKKWSKRRPFGPHENNIVQTVATASGGMSNVFISAIPALYQLQLLRTPAADFFRIVALTAVGGYFGLFTMVPLRKFFMVDVAKELRLLFPSASATAVTIRNMHLAVSGEETARHRTKAIVASFFIALVVRVISQYAIGIFWDWHIFVWARALNILPTWAMALESWGWFLEWSPAMVGSGMLVGCNVAFSFLLGSVVAWGMLGPYLVYSGRAFGTPVSTDTYWRGLMSYTSMSKEFITIDHPSPRYWLLWPGVACMLLVAFIDLACQWPVFWIFVCRAFVFVKNSFRRISSGRFYKYARLNEDTEKRVNNTTDIGARIWIPGTVTVVILACTVMRIQFDMTILEALLALLLAFLLSLSAIQATGATDTTPLTALSKVSQVLLSTTTRGSGISQASAQRLNLLGGSITNIGANQATDLIGDFRVGFLLQTPARLQFLAQLFGTLVATFVAPTVFVLFTQAYPCILEPPESTNGTHVGVCEFPGPTIAAWRAVAVAATEDVLPLPPSSLHFAIAMSTVGALMILIRQFLWTGKLSWVRTYQPNVMIFALAFTLPSAQYAITMVIGALFASLWRSRRHEQYRQYGLAVAAGLVAGEGIGGTINALLSILGFGGDQIGLQIGCPAGQC